MLMVIDVSHNQLQGKLPRSFANWVMLEFLVLSNNDFSDVFPFWLGTLPELKVLALRSNGFHGVLGKPEYSHGFTKLRIFDLSHNNFTGQFLIDNIFSENSMMRVNINVNQSTYMRESLFSAPGNFTGSGWHALFVIVEFLVRLLPSYLQHNDNNPFSLPPCSFLSPRERSDAGNEREALESLAGDTLVEEDKEFGGGLAVWGGRNQAEGGGEDGCGGERG
ncbi:hypothetical protein ACLB2K_073930 [Fragaria x ananassa]